MSSPPTSATCPRCGAAASGRFCAACGAALEGASCPACAAPLTAGARYCHRCGPPAGTRSAPDRGLAVALPWAVAGIALVALIALVVGQRFGSRVSPAGEAAQTADAAPPIAGMPRAPDISQ